MLGTDLVPPRNLRNHRARGIGFRDDPALLFLAPTTPAANASPDLNAATRSRSVKYIVNHICEPISSNRSTSADLSIPPQGAVKRPLTLQAPRQVAATARRYGVSRSLLLRWRRSFRPEPKEAAHQTGFVPAMVVAESGAIGGDNQKHNP
jgi:transposase-like protein